MHSPLNLRLDSNVAAIPHFSQYAGLWAIDERHLQLMVAQASRLHGPELAAHLALNQPKVEAAATNYGYEVNGSIAVIRVAGPMTKHGSSFSPEGSTVRARRAIRNATTDPSITAIMMHWETPGGLVAGTSELSNDIVAAKESKPVWSYIEDLCCSAGYWPASQADRVLSNESADIGSIGVVMAVKDWSKAYEEAGVAVHVIRTGEHKGAGIEGAPIPDSQIAVWQDSVQQSFGMFESAVRSGRSMSKSEFEAVSSGRTWSAKQAQELKLIDGIQSFDRAMQMLAKVKRPSSGRATGISVPEVIMSEEQPKPVAATFKELVAACPGIEANEAGDAMFLADCQKRELTASQATAEWCKTLKDRTAAAREDAKKAQPVAGLVVKLSGLQPVNDAPKGADSGAADTSDPIAAWDEAVEAALPKNGNSRDKARLAVARAKPDLQRAYVNAKNAEAGRTGRI